VFVLSTWRGVGGVSPAELALLGVAGWAVSSQPVVATVCVLVADAVGVVLMLPKTWRDPWSETASTFALAAGSGALGTIAVGAVTVDLLLYPDYFAVVNAVTAGVILGRRRSLEAGARSRVLVADARVAASRAAHPHDRVCSNGEVAAQGHAIWRSAHRRPAATHPGRSAADCRRSVGRVLEDPLER